MKLFFEGVFIKKKKEVVVGGEQALSRAGNFSDRKEMGWFISVSSLLVGARLAFSVCR